MIRRFLFLGLFVLERARGSSRTEALLKLGAERRRFVDFDVEIRAIFPRTRTFQKMNTYRHSIGEVVELVAQEALLVVTLALEERRADGDLLGIVGELAF